MKKGKLKILIVLPIIVILFLSVGVYAGYNYSATNVKFTNDDGTEVSLKEKLDELNGKSSLIANEPDVSKFDKSNTKYVSWSLSDDTYSENLTDMTSTEPADWYDYTAGENRWANVKTTGGGKNCYWVWIPRYAYKVPTRSSGGETIEIKFLKGRTNTPLDGTAEITNTTPDEGTWVVHPAFTNAAVTLSDIKSISFFIYTPPKQSVLHSITEDSIYQIQYSKKHCPYS